MIDEPCTPAGGAHVAATVNDGVATLAKSSRKGRLP
jgi:hypothetical protein